MNQNNHAARRSFLGQTAGVAAVVAALGATLERDRPPMMFAALQAHAGRLAGPGARLEYFTTAWREEIVFHEIKRSGRWSLDLWSA